MDIGTANMQTVQIEQTTEKENYLIIITLERNLPNNDSYWNRNRES